MRQRIPSGNEDVNKVRCKRCGFWCDLSRDSIVQGSGVSITTVTHTSADDPHVDEGVGDSPTYTAGCPQCGKGDYTKNH